VRSDWGLKLDGLELKVHIYIYIYIYIYIFIYIDIYIYIKGLRLGVSGFGCRF
jgi:hypothetical protein